MDRHHGRKRQTSILTPRFSVPKTFGFNSRHHNAVLFWTAVPNHIAHPPPEHEPRDAESRLKVIGVADELIDANVLLGEFRERRRLDVADQPLRPFGSDWLTQSNWNTGEEHSHKDC